MDGIGNAWATPTYGFGMTARAMADLTAGLDTVHLAPPSSDADLADFFDRMRRLRQEALRRAPQARPAQPDRPGAGAAGPLDVKAHGFYKGEEFVPVRSIQVFEVGNYRKRSTGTFNGNWFESEYSHRMEGARAGRHYRAVVTWADGSRQERDIQMDSAEGTSVDIWKH